MSRFFYGKLAFSNIKKNAQTYIPYMLTCAGTIMMYYIIRGLTMNESISKLRGGDSIQMVMGLGGWVIGIFAVIFLFYTNSFLIKRRKKEFGLFNILGMEKHHLARVVWWESLYTFLVSMTVGLTAGVLFSKLSYLGMERLLYLKISIEFTLAPKAMGETLILFAVIFLVNLVNTLGQIHLANPIDLLKGSNVGEKEPKTKWIMAMIGFVFLGIGYYMAATVDNPVDALVLFFIAVILVIIATYSLFTAGSIVVLKLMRRNKKFYYKANHFVSISGMMYRMKQNAAGLASICVLSTGVLILISTTICVYLGTEDSLKTQFPRNAYFNVYDTDKTTAEKVSAIAEQVLGKYDTQKENVLSYFSYYDLLQQKGNAFGRPEDLNSYSGMADLEYITLEEYNRLTNQQKVLQPDEVLLYACRDKYEGDRIQLGSAVLQVKEILTDFPIPSGVENMMINTYYLVIADRGVKDTIQEGLGPDVQERQSETSWGYYYGFDLQGDEEKQIQIEQELQKEFKGLNVRGTVRCVKESKDSFYAMNSGLLFLGVFLGVLFLMATVLIIYYKQISEGYEDRERYQIMRKVGMSRKEVKSSIRSQVLTVFYMPLIMAGIHILFAFQMIKKILNVMGLFNTNLFVMCTVGTMILFAGLYCFVYGMTARTYYKLIS